MYNCLYIEINKDRKKAKENLECQNRYILNYSLSSLKFQDPVIGLFLQQP